MNDKSSAQRRPVRPSDRPALRRCVGEDVESFATKHWGHPATAAPGDELPTPFTDLLSLDAVDELLSRRGLRTPFLRMARDGTVIDPKRWTRSGGAGAEIADQVADEAVGELFADGATAVLQGLHRTWPPIIELATQLALDLGHPVQVNAYITPPSSRGFAAHYDVHDVFVLQVAGEKRWTIHAPVLVSPLRSQVWQDRPNGGGGAAAEPPVLDAVLTPGDALYLPRGYLHSAEALGEVSVHLTVGVHSVTRFAVAEALLDAAADDPALRGSLPLGVDLSDAEAVRPYVEETVQALDRPAGAERPHRCRTPGPPAHLAVHPPPRPYARWRRRQQPPQPSGHGRGAASRPARPAARPRPAACAGASPPSVAAAGGKRICRTAR
jgi:hypothetical protein